MAWYQAQVIKTTTNSLVNLGQDINRLYYRATTFRAYRGNKLHGNNRLANKECYSN
jgi:hypothetical protein